MKTFLKVAASLLLIGGTGTFVMFVAVPWWKKRQEAKKTGNTSDEKHPENIKTSSKGAPPQQNKPETAVITKGK